MKGRTVSLQGTVFFLLCQLLGMGCQQLPWAVSIGGWASILWFALVAAMSCYTACILGSVSDKPLDYPSVIAIGLGPKGRAISQISQCCTLICVASIFLVLAGTNLTEIWPVMNVRLWILTSAAFIFPLCCLRDLRFLQPSSMLGILGAVFTAILCLAAAFRDDAEGLSSNDHFISLTGFPVAGSSFVLAFGCHATLPLVRNSMRDPSQYRKALLWAWLITFIVEMIVIWAALCAFGNEPESPILMSLPAGPERVVCLVLVVIQCLSVMPFLVGAMATKLDSAVGPSRKEWLSLRVLIRLFLVLCYVCVGVSLPHFKELVPIQGALNGTATIYIFPSILQLKLRWHTMRWWERCWCMFILVVAVVISFGFGLFFSVLRLIDRVGAE